MGKKSDAMTEYFSDNERFAGLFNGSFFQGETVVKPQDLKEGSEVYIDDYAKFVVKEDKTAKKNSGRRGGKETDAGQQVGCESDVGAQGAPESEATQKVNITIKDDTIPRTRDVKKRLDSGGTLRVLAIEDQNLVDFTMPWRTMNYDNLEYKRQLNVMKKWNEQEGNLITDSERMSGIRKQDRLNPAFTICLYHGEEEWDGPRSLKDMMDFGADGKRWETLFSDYKMHLVCVNEIEDFSVYGSPLKELFELLSKQKDKDTLKKFVEENQATYETLDEETIKVANVILGGDVIVAKREKNYDEDDMCTGLRGIIEDSKNEGKNEERIVGIQLLVETCQALGTTIEAAVTQLATRYKLTQENARECVNSYWK